MVKESAEKKGPSTEIICNQICQHASCYTLRLPGALWVEQCRIDPKASPGLVGKAVSNKPKAAWDLMDRTVSNIPYYGYLGLVCRKVQKPQGCSVFANVDSLGSNDEGKVSHAPSKMFLYISFGQCSNNVHLDRYPFYFGL